MPYRLGCRVVRRQLAIEEAARQREAIIAPRQDRVRAKAKGRLARAASDDGAVDPQPVLLKQYIIGAIIETKRELLMGRGAGGKGGVGPPADLQALRIEQPAGIGSLERFHEQPAIRRRERGGRRLGWILGRHLPQGKRKTQQHGRDHGGTSLGRTRSNASVEPYGYRQVPPDCGRSGCGLHAATRNSRCYNPQKWQDR